MDAELLTDVVLDSGRHIPRGTRVRILVTPQGITATWFPLSTRPGDGIVFPVEPHEIAALPEE